MNSLAIVRPIKNALFLAVMSVVVSITMLNSTGAYAVGSEMGAAEANPLVQISTNKGDILVKLYAARAPISVNNFLEYVDSGFYTNTIFHRVIKDFMIQGGGFNTDMTKKSVRAPIKNEADNRIKNSRGTLAMARTNAVDSATSQFFINHKDNSFLDHKNSRSFGYAVFGEVIKGMDVVDRIARAATRRDAPVQQVVIKSVKRVSAMAVKPAN